MFKLSPSEPTDFFGIVRLLKLSNLQTSDIGGSKVVNNFISAYAENGDLAGVIGIEMCDYNMLVRSLALDKRYEGQKVEDALVQKVEDTGLMKGMRKFYTLVHRAWQEFYEKRGYEIVTKNWIPLNIKATDEYAFFKNQDDFVCLMRKTEHFVQADDDEHEVYNTAK